MSRRVLALIVVLALALAILTGLAVRRGILGSDEQTAAVGGPFQLVDQTGATVDQDVLKGKWSAVFFGFTHCPDICPTTLFEMAQVERELAGQAGDLQTVFISVDPQRDTVGQVAAYLNNPDFPKQLVGLTGTPEQVDRAAKAYHVYYSKSGEGADYTVNHASYTYLMSPKGRFVCVLPYELTPEQTAAKIKAAMAQGADAQRC
ncbi:SCO family protein [Phenylobacterium sp.]|uniref:SCO family protein n=1 Tax=Phenylobacterium sp. TaxID=1871053 RepID=UPI0028111420|nr:SCO family protein [Phenylobacterium sp.]